MLVPTHVIVMKTVRDVTTLEQVLKGRDIHHIIKQDGNNTIIKAEISDPDKILDLGIILGKEIELGGQIISIDTTQYA